MPFNSFSGIVSFVCARWFDFSACATGKGFAAFDFTWRVCLLNHEDAKCNSVEEVLDDYAETIILNGASNCVTKHLVSELVRRAN